MKKTTNAMLSQRTEAAMLKTIVMIGVVWVFLMSGCKTAGYPLSITVKNTTDTDITLVSFSDKVQSDAPIHLKSQDSVVVYSDPAGDIDFV